MTGKIEEAMKPPQNVTALEPAASRVSGSRVSRGWRVSVASRDAEISAKLKALELRQLRARQKREEEQKQPDELMEAARRRREEEQKQQDELMEAERPEARKSNADQSR